MLACCKARKVKKGELVICATPRSVAERFLLVPRTGPFLRVFENVRQNQSRGKGDRVEGGRKKLSWPPVAAQKTKVAKQFQVQAVRNDVEKQLEENVEESTMIKRVSLQRWECKVFFFGFFHSSFFQALSAKL